MTSKKIIRLSASPPGFGDTPDELTSDMFVTKLPVQHSHEYYKDDELGLYVGVWDTTDMIEAAGPYTCDEFMWLIEGEAAIRNCQTGEMEKVSAGEPFIIPRGYECQWHQVGYLRKFFVISENPNEPVPDKPTVESIIVPKADAPMKPQLSSQPFLMSDRRPIPKQNVCYRNCSGKFLSGTWECEPFESKMSPFPYHEFAYLISGSLTLEDEQGNKHFFKSGDAVFLPKGVVCSAQATEKLKLFFAIIDRVNNDQ